MFTNNNGNNSYDFENEQHKTETLIGHLVIVDGNMTSRGNITIDGEFKGTLVVGGKLTVGKDAKITAQISAKDAFIAGTINGNLSITEKIELSNSAKITGDVNTNVLVMEAGATLNGSCKMGTSQTISGVCAIESPNKKQDEKVDKNKK